MLRRGSRILVAAGDSSIAARFGNALEIAGFEVVVVGCGADAMCVCARRAPDLLVCDADLPDVAAIQLARRLRRRGAQFPVILLADEFLTVDALCADRAPTLPATAHVIPAPCDEQRLVDLILEMTGEFRTLTPGCSEFPTRVIWPTARRLPALAAR